MLKEQRQDILSVLEKMRTDLDNGLVPTRVFGDEEIFKLELEKVFANSWTYLGHESEIPNVGDYARRSIGLDPFVLARDEDKKIHAFFNSCRHRGATICRAEKGNSSHFRCSYHGWTYRNNGDLVGVPQQASAYKGLNLEDWGLFEAPRVESYQGLIFASLSPKGLSLDQYLGDFKWYLDTNMKLTGGLEVVGEPNRWLVDVNWKIGALNFAGDAYHLAVVHKSAQDTGLAYRYDDGTTTSAIHKEGQTAQIAECGGHSSGIRMAGPEDTVFWGYPKPVIDTFVPESVTKQQYETARRSITQVGTIFPNLSYIHTAVTDAPERPVIGFLSLRQWQPRGPGKMEIISWTMVPKNAPKEYKERSYKVAINSFSPSGNYEQDDIAVWRGISEAGGSLFAKRFNVKLNFQMGFDWMSDTRPRNDWGGPGTAYDSNLEEGTQRTFWRSWLKTMLE